MFAYGISSQFNSLLTRLSPVSLILNQLNSGWTLVHALTWENVCVSNICRLLWTFVVELIYFSVKLRVCLREMTLEYESFCIHFVNSKGHFIWSLSSGWGNQWQLSVLQIKDKKTFKTCSSSIGHLNLAPKGAIFQTPVLQYPNFKKKQQNSKNKNKKLVILCTIRGLATLSESGQTFVLFAWLHSQAIILQSH